MVRRVGFARSRIYLELVPRDGPTIVVARRLETALAREGRPAGAMVGQTISARGALGDRLGSGDPGVSRRGSHEDRASVRRRGTIIPRHRAEFANRQRLLFAVGGYLRHPRPFGPGQS